jgi:hypothetical protein
MMQGCSLEAAIADCGDELGIGGLSEMMTAYVILSRVKRAHGLLLLRAFSPELFRMGMAPGPYCLLKLLRHRFGEQDDTGTAHGGNAKDAGSDYRKESAIAEHGELETTLKRQKAMRKQRGIQFTCFDSGHALPPECYGADPKSHDEIREMCRGRLLATLQDVPQ